MSAKEINCPCGQPDKGFMIECDRCEVWYHGPCAGETAKSSKNKPKWFCEWCKGLRLHFHTLLKGQDALVKKVAKLEREILELRGNRWCSEKVVTEERDSTSTVKAVPYCEKCCTDHEATAKLQKKLSDTQQKVDSLEIELNAKSKKLKHLENRCCENCKRNQDFALESQRRLDNSQTKVDSLQAELKAKIEEVMVLKNLQCENCISNKDAATESKIQLANAQVKASTLETQLNAKQEEVKTLNSKISELNKEIEQNYKNYIFSE
ncbi:hypothetical protein ONE63_008195 [Megalurothrips usitatus]|uniref:PHD-type domain-containing protein n=1 Tax=Megalurothrips usitatus TaxID=439358 RepID=A0AAV7XMX5_9NEOP|nr:hypothetical protein ONE63_008195 [Megalurothrips usitatus]